MKSSKNKLIWVGVKITRRNTFEQRRFCTKIFLLQGWIFYEKLIWARRHVCTYWIFIYFFIFFLVPLLLLTLSLGRFSTYHYNFHFSFIFFITVGLISFQIRLILALLQCRETVVFRQRIFLEWISFGVEYSIHDRS